jgi:capsule polysaccharide export protein KpsC/LpsZ
MALTLRTPHLLDQLALVDYLCRSVPHTHVVVVKEHPAMVGAIDAQRVVELLKRHDNLRLLPPSTNNYAVLRAAATVVSINSKSGAEAALLGKPVIVLGDAFYRDSALVQRIDRLQDLPWAVSTSLARGVVPARQEAIEAYFADVWQQCVPGELYVPETENVRAFTQGLLQAILPSHP